MGDNRYSPELRNDRIPRIFWNYLSYEYDTDSLFTCILRNFGLEHCFVHLQRAGSLILIPTRNLSDFFDPHLRRPRGEAPVRPEELSREEQIVPKTIRSSLVSLEGHEVSGTKFIMP